ncbi:O-antigen ligase family protein [Sphingomonas ginsenosidimutans]|nr:O-antigen ligase family protein [Sphingomonas ginsenosidimutans]
MIVLLWVAGGASRADAMGQVVVRAGAWALLVVASLAGPRPDLAGCRAIVWLLAATIALPFIQLIPLPPAWWQALPGRAILSTPGQAVPWRPWTMTPGATRNALASLVVPVAMFVILAQGKARVHRWMPTMLLGMIGAAVLLGLLQFSGAGFNSPFLNDTPGLVSSIFANRNHFALFVAMGCLIAPAWAFMDREALRWRGPLAAGLVIVFVLTILATGSRAGILLGGVALALALLLVGRNLRRRLRGGPRWLLPACVVAAILVIGGFIALSFAADRAVGISRLITLEVGEDMRSRARPTVLAMIALYMPFGSGLGGFDPVFRIHEPFALLKPTYFNQAHNDYLGIALDAGIAGILILVAAIGWWALASIRVWRAKGDHDILLGRLGSAMILLVLIASTADYPARTPTVMALVVVAAMWLARGKAHANGVALPS